MLAIDRIFDRWNWLTVIISNQIFSERTYAYDLIIGRCSRRKKANDTPWRWSVWNPVTGAWSPASG